MRHPARVRWSPYVVRLATHRSEAAVFGGVKTRLRLFQSHAYLHLLNRLWNELDLFMGPAWCPQGRGAGRLARM